jgi:hypothetical protein
MITHQRDVKTTAPSTRLPIHSQGTGTLATHKTNTAFVESTNANTPLKAHKHSKAETQLTELTGQTNIPVTYELRTIAHAVRTCALQHTTKVQLCKELIGHINRSSQGGCITMSCTDTELHKSATGCAAPTQATKPTHCTADNQTPAGVKHLLLTAWHLFEATSITDNTTVHSTEPVEHTNDQLRQEEQPRWLHHPESDRNRTLYDGKGVCATSPGNIYYSLHGR